MCPRGLLGPPGFGGQGKIRILIFLKKDLIKNPGMASKYMTHEHIPYQNCHYVLFETSRLD